MSLQLSTKAFWQFSIKLYEQPQVQQLLLDAQNKQGTNVNLALFCAWLNQQHWYLSQQHIEKIESVLLPFSEQCTQTLRLSRHNLRQFQQQLDNYQQLKTNLLSSELELEKIEQQLIVTTFNQLSKTLNQSLTSGDNLLLYQQHIHQQLSPTSPQSLPLTDLNQYLN